MKRKDSIILLLAVVLAGLTLLASQHLPGRKLDIAAQVAPDTAVNPKDQEGLSLVPWSAGDTLPRGENYLVVSQGKTTYTPIPLSQVGTLAVRQHDGKENTISLNIDSFCMNAANCENQACVLQGHVTGDNRNQRVLQNMIICLPNEVILEMMNRAEAEDYLGIAP
jgi:hypothetical protein